LGPRTELELLPRRLTATDSAFQDTRFADFSFAFSAGVNQRVLGSSPDWGANSQNSRFPTEPLQRRSDHAPTHFIDGRNACYTYRTSVSQICCLRLRTPWLLLRLDYRIKVDRRPGESLGRIFFSIGRAL